jgi:hypothetical protein
MSQTHHALVEAALLLDRSIRLFLTESEGLHAETWILAVARMAGTELQREIFTSGDSRDGVGGGRSRAGGGNPRPRLWNLAAGGHDRPFPSSEDQGRRLVALLLASLAQLGEPLAEEAIACPTEGSACARLSLDQTRRRLGALVAACGRSHGLGAGEMAEALTIATALALHQCRDLLPLTRGAGLAVMGLVEGAKSAETLTAAV